MTASRIAYGASLALALASIVGSATYARADVGEKTSVAIVAAQGRPMWKHVAATTGHVGGDESAPSFRKWERDSEPEERRYEIVIRDERSSEESFSGSATASNDPFAGAARGLRSAVSAAAFADFRAARLARTVTSAPLRLAQSFYRGKKWGFILGHGAVATHGVSTFTWTEVAAGALSDRLRAAEACAKTGECGE